MLFCFVFVYYNDNAVKHQGTMRPDEALKILAVFDGKLTRLKEERDNLAKAKEALELAEPGDHEVLFVLYCR